MPAIAAEHLVAAVARENDLHAARRLPREQMQGDVGGAAERRVTARDEVVEIGEQLALLQHDLVMLGAEMLRELRRRGELASFVVGKSGRERGDALAVALHERDDRRRVVTAGEEDAHGARSAHGELDRLVELGDEALDRLALRAKVRGRFAVWRTPVADLAQVAELPQGVAARRELAHARHQRARPGHIAQREIVADRSEVDLAFRAGCGNERLQLGGEVKRRSGLAKIERLLAEAVSREHQPVLARVPEREGERAAQLLHHFLVPVLVGAQQELRIAGAAECIAAPAELLAQLRGVEDGAIEGERDTGRRVRKRRRHHHRASRIAVDEGAYAFGLVAMRERLDHRRQRAGMRRAVACCPAR